ncbi:UNKNOWN [Stylonychia lemnae]|uniref:Cyclic nucleotide-binding domain-containing protein n=1 Tax=Stylonychia lemnae TaxID=5949 RepID=A0A077ZYE6_STYLE|nr:UNKNOWN [Stylonychia lemnae]|eukprot:CDW74956.1 UNKNOWN [Stylonychia lemnae]
MVPLIREIAFFKRMNIQGPDLSQICHELKYEFYREGESVFRQGEYGDKFYIILKGEVSVKIPDPKRKNEPQKPGEQQKQSVASSATQRRESVLVTQATLSFQRKNTLTSTQTLKLPNTKDNTFLTAPASHTEMTPKPQLEALTPAARSLHQFAEEQKKQRRHTMNFMLGPTKLGQTKPNQVSSLLKQKDSQSQIVENEYEESNEDSKDQTLSDVSPLGDIESEEEEEDQEDDEDIKVMQSVEEQQDLIAKALEEDEFLIQVAKLVDGSSFGELALLEQKPRAATIRCLQNSHFMVLTKNDYVKVIGKIERRTYNEKINFLRNIPVFQLLTRTSLGKMTYYFDTKNCIRDSILYKEGDNAEFVYIVKKGELEATKKILHTGPKAENIEEILENPLKANKHMNNLFSKNTLRQLFITGISQLIGDEDVALNSTLYQTTIRCISQTGELIRIKREDFQRLQAQGPTWNEILKSVTEKKRKIQLCLFQTRASKIRIENQLEHDTNIIKDQIKNELLANPIKDNSAKKARTHQNSINASVDYTKYSNQGLNFKDLIQAYANKQQTIETHPSLEDTATVHTKSFLDPTVNSSLPTIVDNKRIFQSLHMAHMSKSNDRNKMSQTIRLNANRLKTLKPQATLFPVTLNAKLFNQDNALIQDFHQGPPSVISKYNQVINLQSNEFAFRSSSQNKSKY